MGKKKENRDYAYAAAKALSDLNMIEAVKALCESSLFSSHCHGFEARVVKVCNAEAAKCLRRYDQALTYISELDVKP